MSHRMAAAAAIGLALMASACQTVIESGDETPLTPLGTSVAAITTSTTTTTTVAPTTTAPPLTTTTVPATTVPATTSTTTTTTTMPATTTTTTPATTTPPSTTSTTTTTTPPSTTSTTTTTEPFYRDEPSSGALRERDRGDRTQAMQAKLIALGYLNPGANDGLFGKVTTAAVKRFQQDNDLQVDGLVGPITSSALDAAVDEL